MRARILPTTIVLTKGCRAMVNGGQEAYCGPRTSSEMCTMVHGLTRREYWNRIGPNPKYSPLVSTGWQ